MIQRAYRKLRTSVREVGVARTVLKALRYPVDHPRYLLYRRFIEKASAREVFTRIYEKNIWESKESISGPGSTLEYTARLRSDLPRLLSLFHVRSVFDAPCGDFNWMRKVLDVSDIRYHGADIVPELIKGNKAHEIPGRTRFSVHDIISDPFPSADLWICRECLFHFSYADIYRTLNNFVSSDIGHILTTTHINQGEHSFVNRDILTGEYRRIDLFSPPFNFPKDVAARITDWIEPYEPREMCLWTRSQVQDSLPHFAKAAGID